MQNPLENSTPSHPDRQDLFAGLKVLVESAFPKRCQTCGREYASLDEFIRATRELKAHCPGFKQSFDDDGNPIVELFRNCVCGSTLLETLHSRRDESEAGHKQRRRFRDMLEKLVAAGIDSAVARTELRKLMRGRPNAVIDLIRAAKAE